MFWKPVEYNKVSVAFAWDRYKYVFFRNLLACTLNIMRRVTKSIVKCTPLCNSILVESHCICFLRVEVLIKTKYISGKLPSMKNVKIFFGVTWSFLGENREKGQICKKRQSLGACMFTLDFLPSMLRLDAKQMKATLFTQAMFSLYRIPKG